MLNKTINLFKDRTADEFLYLVGVFFRKKWYSWNYMSNRACFNAGRNGKIIGYKNINLGGNVSLGDNFWIQALVNLNCNCSLEFGNNFIASNNLHIGCFGHISIGNNVLIGSNVLIIDHNHGAPKSIEHEWMIPPAKRELEYTGKIIIEDNVWICDNVTILGGAHIESGAIIPVNSVVKGWVSACTVFK